MVIFLANIDNIHTRSLHRKIKERFQHDNLFSNTRMKPSGARDPGPYRVKTETNPQMYLNNPSYPVTNARLEIGFDKTNRPGQSPNYNYWFNWIEPTRDFSLCWHQDQDHASLGQVHIQVNHQGQPVEHRSAQFIDKHPLAILEKRLNQLPQALNSVTWQKGQVHGIVW